MLAGKGEGDDSVKLQATANNFADGDTEETNLLKPTGKLLLHTAQRTMLISRHQLITRRLIGVNVNGLYARR